VVSSLHLGVTREQVAANTGWAVRFAETAETTAPPTDAELAVLRDLQERTARAHEKSPV
jgi:glutaconate CoA-transferase subunit B